MKKGAGGEQWEIGGRGGNLTPVTFETPPGAGAFSADCEHRKAERERHRTKLVAVTERGERVGEDHQRAKLTNAQVEAMRDRFEAFPVGHPEHEGYRVLAKAFGCDKGTVRDVVSYRRRLAWAARFKRVDK